MKWVPLSLSLFLLLVPPAVASPAPSSSEARVSLDFKDVDIVDVVRILAEVGSFQVVVDPGVSCKLTLKLNEVRWVQALDVALKSCGLAREEDGGIMRVGTAARLLADQKAQRDLAEAQALNRPLKTRSYRLSYARAAEVAPIIQKTLLSSRGSVYFDARTNTLFIQDVE
jgi:type IV pilus assembly protein PilQ